MILQSCIFVFNWTPVSTYTCLRYLRSLYAIPPYAAQQAQSLIGLNSMKWLSERQNTHNLCPSLWFIFEPHWSQSGNADNPPTFAMVIQYNTTKEHRIRLRLCPPHKPQPNTSMPNKACLASCDVAWILWLATGMTMLNGPKTQLNMHEISPNICETMNHTWGVKPTRY
jgi:hypothetical protein